MCFSFGLKHVRGKVAVGQGGPELQAQKALVV